MSATQTVQHTSEAPRPPQEHDGPTAPQGLLGSTPVAPQPQTRKVRRVWAQDVIVRADLLQARLESLCLDLPMSRGNAKLALRAGERLAAAKDAALKVNPAPRRLSNWWRGTLIDAAYQNLHAAEILMTSLYDDAQAEAEVPEAIARVEARLGRDDPRRAAALALECPPRPGVDRRARLAKAVQVGFEAADAEYARVRSFRNALLGSAAILGLALIAFVTYAWSNPSVVPVCFTPRTGPVCASGGASAASEDIATVVAIGALGGLLSAIVSIRNMHGTSVAYDVPTALAMLKLPVGGLAAVGGLLVVRAQFVPGLSDLDSQAQILAYAFVFGVGQQLVVGLIDKQANELLSAAPGKATSASRRERETGPGQARAWDDESFRGGPYDASATGGSEEPRTDS